MKLGKYFTLKEMTRTSEDADNSITDWITLINLTRLVALVLDPLRATVGRIDVTNAFRSILVNIAVGGANGSYHLFGLAADIVSATLSVQQLCDAVISLGLSFDKMIMEDDGEHQWLHVQIKPPGEVNRHIVMTAKMVNGEMVYEEVV